MQTASFTTLIAALVLICLLVIIGVSRLARLLFRHRLEVIRDECVDAILEGHLHKTPSVRHFLRTVEAGTAVSHVLTLPRLFALAEAMIDVGVPIESIALPTCYADLEPAERKIMYRLEDGLCSAYRSYLNWGSPASWPRRPFVCLAGLIHPSGRTAKAKEALPAVAREELEDTGVRPPTLPSTRHLLAGRY
jgi:hypothetical protein